MDIHFFEHSVLFNVPSEYYKSHELADISSFKLSIKYYYKVDVSASGYHNGYHNVINK